MSIKSKYHVSPEFLAKIKGVLDGGKQLTPTQLLVCELLGMELKSLKSERTNKGGNGMKRNRIHEKEQKAEKKHVVKRVGFGSGVVNFDALGHKIKESVTIGAYAANHPNCFIQIKDGVAKRMEDTNESVGGHGHAALVYRTPAVDRD